MDVGQERDLNRALLEYLEPPERALLERLLKRAQRIWSPLPGPQTEAYYSRADILGYGGAAGGGKTDLGIGLALTQHQNIMICRQNGTELTAIIDRIAGVLGSRSGFNGTDRIWRVQGSEGRPVQIELGSFPNPGEEVKYQGRPHDLLVFDEATNMRERAVRFLLGWLRSVDPAQRKRVVLTFNPPTTVEGRWVIDFFGPWLDKKHPKPAQPGELRWYATVEGKDEEVKDGEPFLHKGELITPLSRTFIPSRVSDNPHLFNTGYMAQLQSLPEPLRSQMLHGDFTAGMEDDPWQVIYTSWVEKAMARWKKPDQLPEMDSMGVDVALGGKDMTVLARRHGMWFDEPIEYEGHECRDGPTVAGYVIAALRDKAVIHIDVFGVGAQPYGHLMRSRQQVIAVNVGDPSGNVTLEGNVRFRNLRSELWWRMREALDPHANTGIALPPSRRLLADLCAPKWRMAGGLIEVQSRDEIIKTIGRSPDHGSAYCLALMETMKRSRARSILRGPERREYDPFKHL